MSTRVLSEFLMKTLTSVKNKPTQKYDSKWDSGKTGLESDLFIFFCTYREYVDGGRSVAGEEMSTVNSVYKPRRRVYSGGRSSREEMHQPIWFRFSPDFCSINFVMGAKIIRNKSCLAKKVIFKN